MTCGECRNECLLVAVIAETQTLCRLYFCPICHRTFVPPDEEGWTPAETVVELSPVQTAVLGLPERVPEKRRMLVHSALLHLGEAFRRERYVA